MGNITTNETSPLKNQGQPLLLWVKGILESASKPEQSFLNVPRENVYLYTIITCLKNAFVCYGMSNLVPPYMTVGVLITFSCFQFVPLIGSYVVNLSFIWACWTAILCGNSRFLNLTAILRCSISLIILFVVPFAFPVHVQLVFLIDIFCIVFLILHILDAFWEEDEILLAFILTTGILIVLSIDSHLKANGLFFEAIVIMVACFPEIIYDYTHGKTFDLVMMSCLFGIGMHYIIYKANMQTIDQA